MPKDTPGRIATLDGLRAISILIVFGAHLGGTRNAMHAAPQFFADLGVRTFFVISGFLITTLLLRERTKTGSISLRSFYVRRVFRIFPAFYFYLACMVILSALGWIEISNADFAFAATYTMNFHAHRAWWVGHLWSLAVEEQFYLLWPFMMYALGTPRARNGALVAIACAPILRVVATRLWPVLSDLNDQAFPFVFDSLAIGCVLAIARDLLEANKRYIALLDSPVFWIVPALCIVALSIEKPIFNLGVGVSAGNLGIALTIHKCVRAPETLVGRALEWRPLVWIGTLSYSLYLWQQPFLNRHSDGWFAAFPQNLGLAVAAAMVSYYLVERPVLRWRARRRR
ncbi:MAG: acyltransferase [Kofleriaceae bacterium]